MIGMLLALPAIVTAPKAGLAPAELKGVRLGMTMEEVIAAIRVRNEAFEPSIEYKGWNASFSEDSLAIAGKVANLVFYHFVEHKGHLRLAEIIAFFDSDSYAGIWLGLQKKYGSPVERVEPFLTKGGVRTKSEVATWKAQDAKVVLTQRRFRLDEGTLEITSATLGPKYYAEIARVQDKEASDI